MRVANTRFGAITTNGWGMRDRDYELLPAGDTFRIAILGASTVMGWGVSAAHTFENLVEDRLNRERSGRPFARYEILNFGSPGYELPQQLATLEKERQFGPHSVIYAAIGRELHGSVTFLADVGRAGTAIPYGFLGDRLRQAGVDRGTDETTAQRRLEPHRGEIVSSLYREMAALCERNCAVPIIAFLPPTYRGVWEQEAEEVLRRAADGGFVALDLREIFRKEDTRSLRLAEWDAHPNTRGHQFMANELYDAMVGRADVIFVKREARK